MACKLNSQQINEVCEITANFVADVLCPKFEQLGCAKPAAELKASIGATLMTVGEATVNGTFKFAKSGDKFVFIDNSESGDDDDDDGDEPKEDGTCKVATEGQRLIREIVKLCDKYGKDNQEKCANYASIVLTMMETAPKGAKAMMMQGIVALMTGEIKL